MAQKPKQAMEIQQQAGNIICFMFTMELHPLDFTFWGVGRKLGKKRSNQ